MAGQAPLGATDSRDAAELERFRAIAEAWWDPEGDFRPLHRLNPVRLAYIRDRACEHFGRSRRTVAPLEGLSVLDVGCGGGLLCEPMARLGARTTGVDALARNIEIARLHAEGAGLAIDYRVGTAEALLAAGERYDIVLNMEVVEHVADAGAFLADTARLVAPGGLIFASTLNRTRKAFALAVVGAEYVLRWLPRGTHDWRKFLRPSELVRGLEAGGVEMADMTGVVFNPLTGEWSLNRRDLDVNYMGMALRPA